MLEKIENLWEGEAETLYSLWQKAIASCFREGQEFDPKTLPPHYVKDWRRGIWL